MIILLSAVSLQATYSQTWQHIAITFCQASACRQLNSQTWQHIAITFCQASACRQLTHKPGGKLPLLPLLSVWPQPAGNLLANLAVYCHYFLPVLSLQATYAQTWR